MVIPKVSFPLASCHYLTVPILVTLLYNNNLESITHFLTIDFTGARHECFSQNC